jgi:lipopolysaccharide/colanic/teichoic acid biosynthesis glycosyltransferase
MATAGPGAAVGSGGTPRSGLPRAVEALVAFVGLVFSAPFLAVAAALVAVTSPGGAFFRQERVGRDGSTFVLYKLRTMRSSAGGSQVTASDDARITRVGRLLRWTKLDELPQLWNVLWGEMSLVGPRPEVPRYVNPGNPLWREVLRVRPGMTDPVSLSLRDEEALLARVAGDRERFYMEELQPVKLRQCLEYLQGRSFWTDLRVLGRTGLELLIPRRWKGVKVGPADVPKPTPKTGV